MPFFLPFKQHAHGPVRSKSILYSACSPGKVWQKIGLEFSALACLFLRQKQKGPGKKTQLLVHVCKREHVSRYGRLCECGGVALCALAFLWHFNFMLSNSLAERRESRVR